MDFSYLHHDSLNMTEMTNILNEVAQINHMTWEHDLLSLTYADIEVVLGIIETIDSGSWNNVNVCQSPCESAASMVVTTAMQPVTSPAFAQERTPARQQASAPICASACAQASPQATIQACEQACAQACTSPQPVFHSLNFHFASVPDIGESSVPESLSCCRFTDRTDSPHVAVGQQGQDWMTSEVDIISSISHVSPTAMAKNFPHSEREIKDYLRQQISRNYGMFLPGPAIIQQ